MKPISFESFNPRFDLLPQELILEIFSYIRSFKTLGRMALLCKKTRDILKRPDAWKGLVEEYWNKRVTTQCSINQLATEGNMRTGLNYWLFLSKCLANEGKEDGYSTLIVKNSKFRIGQHKKGKFCGYGAIVWDDIYCLGTWTKKGGEGVLVWYDGERYQGHLSNDGIMCGKGYYYWTDGMRYEGTFEPDAISRGTMTWPTGLVYTGEWINDELNGRGTMTWPDKFQYRGQWKNNTPLRASFCIHPTVKKLIKKEKCTRNFTGKLDYPQMITWCKICQSNFCVSCQKSCHINNGHAVINSWSMANYCECKKCNE